MPENNGHEGRPSRLPDRTTIKLNEVGNLQFIEVEVKKPTTNRISMSYLRNITFAV
jgi:hypothetical protein